MKKLLGLEKGTFRKSVRWALDQDYLTKLTLEEKEFLSQFNDEYYGHKFNKNVIPLHKSKEQQIDCSRRADSARRDIYTYNTKTKEINE